MAASSRRAFAKLVVSLAVSLAPAGCADGEFDQSMAGNAEAIGQVSQAFTVDDLTVLLGRLESPLASCKAQMAGVDISPSVWEIKTEGSWGEGEAEEDVLVDVLRLRGNVTLPANCVFSGYVLVDRENVVLDCNGSVIDARQSEYNGIGAGGKWPDTVDTDALRAAHGTSCAYAYPPVGHVTIRNCTVQYAQEGGISFDRKLGGIGPGCTTEYAAFFGPSDEDGVHDRASPLYLLPEYLRQEIRDRDAAESTHWADWLDSDVTDGQVMDLLRRLGPHHIELDNVKLLYNQRVQLYVRHHTTDFTLKSSRLVQSPDGAALGTLSGSFACRGNELNPAPGDPIYPAADTWACGDVGDSKLGALCYALQNTCKGDAAGDANRYSIYVDRESQHTSIQGTEFRRDMTSGPYAARAPGDVRTPNPTHIALDSTADNEILSNTFSGKANGILSFKNCGEKNSYRFQNSERNLISGNTFALAPEATAVWLSSRQGGRYNADPDSPFNCFLDGEVYPWLKLPPTQERLAVVQSALSNLSYCRQELPPMASSSSPQMFYDFSLNNDVHGNWFIRQPTAMPSVIVWERSNQASEGYNSVAGNFANFDNPNPPAGMEMVCRLNHFLAQVNQARGTVDPGVSVMPPPGPLSNTSVAQLHMAFSAL